MGYKPADLFVGVIDIFAILLPGALLAFVTKDAALAQVFGPILPPVRGVAQGWISFVFASYFLGHFIFLVGSVLDTTVYDPYRKKFITREFEPAEDREQGEGHKRFFEKLFPKEADLLYERARKIKEQHVGDSEGPEAISTFKWAKASIQLRGSAALVEINRLEADSKFFRSLIVVLFLISLILVFKAALMSHGTALIGTAVCLLLMVLSFLRYAEQRFKSTQLAYTYLIALDKLDSLDENAEEAGRDREPLVGPR